MQSFDAAVKEERSLTIKGESSLLLFDQGFSVFLFSAGVKISGSCFVMK